MAPLVRGGVAGLIARPGVRPAALADVRRILDGDADHIDPRRLSYIGHLVDAAE